MVALIAEAAIAFDGMDLNWQGSGARARAMGGAFVSLSNDASAITWNPAGLIRSLDPQASFTGVYSGGSHRFNLGYPNANNSEFASNGNAWGPDFGSFLAPVKIAGKQFSAGFSIRKLDELNFARISHPSWQADEIVTSLVNPEREIWQYGRDPTVASTLTETSEGSLNVINLGLGTNITDQLAAGLSANIYFGSSEEKTDATTEWVEEVIIGSSTQYMDRLWRGHFLYESDYSGFNLTLGLQYQSEMWSAGAVLSSPFELVREYQVTQGDTAYTKLQGDQYVFQPVEEKDYWILVDKKQKLEIPWSAAVGVSYKIAPNFLVAADVAARRFGKSKVSVLDSAFISSSGDKEEYFRDSTTNYRNSGEVRVGFEYMIDRESYSVPVRGGFKYVMDYLTQADGFRVRWDRNSDDILSYSMRTDYSDRVTGIGYSLGSGIHWRQIWLDAAFEYYTDTRDYDGLDFVGNVQAENKYKLTRITLNFTGFF